MTDELYHFGVKGMKWGVRRYEDKHGHLTALGKKRYSEKDSSSAQPKQKSKHRQRLEDAYRKNGMSKEQAERAADQRIKSEKILAIAAGVTVAAATAYVVHNQIKIKTDGLIKSGSDLQRIEMQNTNGKLYDVFYAAQGKHDTTRYKNMLGAVRQKETGEAYIMKLRAKNDIKVASQDKAYKSYKKLYENDSDFRKQIDQNLALLPKNIRKGRRGYEEFNRGVVYLNKSDSSLTNKFYKELKSQGYGAIQDINDMKYSGYNAKNPLIIFDNDNSKNIMVESFEKITKDMEASGKREEVKIAVENSLKTAGLYSWMGLALGTAAGAQDLYESNPENNIKKRE